MAGAFSGHLLDCFKSTPSIVTSGAMSFSPQAHGFYTPLFGNIPSMDPSEETATKIATLQAKLNKKLGPEFISQRPGPGGGPKLTYAEGWKIINLANDVFGFNGWSSSIINITTDFVDYSEESRRYNVGVTAIVRVTLKDGVHHEDVGYGLLENSKSKGAALDKCKKEAVTDALKRTLRNFGNLLGNCLYDKAYAQEVVKIKVPPAKFDKNDLYRRPEFEDPKPTVSSVPPSAPAQPPHAGSSNREPVREKKPPVKSEPASEKAEKPIAYIPRHLRREVVSPTAQQTMSPKETAQEPSGQPVKDASLAANRLGAQRPIGLHTPIQTSAQRIPQQARGQLRHNEQSPLARQQPQNRRGSFPEVAEDDASVELPSPSGEENYGLNSEDDAFLAAIDLGEGDLGRPIDFDEGFGDVSMMDDSSVDHEQGDIAKSPAVQHAQVNIGGVSGNSESGAQVRRAVTGAGSTTSTTSGPPERRPGVLKVNHGTAGSRPPMHPPLQKPPLPRQDQQQANHQAAPPASGVKRSADAMQGSSSSSLRPQMRGMGLTRSPQQNAGVVRQSAVGPDPITVAGFKRTKR